MASSTDFDNLRKRLLTWWDQNHREFPWRHTHDSYKILASEILLHRTKAEQVVQVYNRFLTKFPTVQALFSASLHEKAEVLRPLGLYWRTRLLHEMSIVIWNRYDGNVPSTRKELESLPGVGKYIASAVCCFAFNHPEVLLDTNTVRIFGRIFGEKVNDASRRSKHFQRLGEYVLDKENARAFNYALIDLGALVCKPKEPLCNKCPLNDVCSLGGLRMETVFARSTK
jgi:A/G-specific adenine glycosylase